jgi:hypothetical protein
MIKIIQRAAFGSFQIINTITAFFMTFFPRQMHESLFTNPDLAYTQLGFSPLAVSMVHNVIRGQGAVLLAISIFIFYLGWKNRASYLLMFLVCLFSLGAHAATMVHHIRHPQVLLAVGSLGSLYVAMGINVVVGFLNLETFIFWRRTKAILL